MIRTRMLAVLLTFANQAQPFTPYVDLTGAYQTNPLKHTTQILEQTPWPPDRYQTQAIDHTTVFELGTGAFFETQNPKFPYLSLGLNLQRTQQQTISGTIEPFSCPELTPVDFKYKTQQHRFLLQTHVYFMSWQDFMPFITLGLGIARLWVDPVRMESPTFQHKIRYAFAGQTGLGIAYPITQQSLLGLGVRYETPVTLRIGPLSQSLWGYSLFAQFRTVFF